MIPRSKVVSNIEKSRISILQQGINKPLLFNSNAYILDTFSDGIMINMSYAVESSKPIKSALEGNQKILRNSANVSENLTNLFSDSITSNWSYGRYWHGWMVVIRPLLVFFDYSEIRYLNIIFMTLLLIIFLGMVYKYIGINAELAFILGFLLVNFWIVPLCLHYSSVFYLALIFGIILILLRNKPHIFGLCFFTVGSLTCFFDLLSAPMVTLGVCLVLAYMLISNNHHTFLSEAKIMFNYCVLWFLGYSLTWATKIMLLLTLNNKTVFTEAISQIILRSGSNSGKVMSLSQRFLNIEKNFEMLGLNKILLLVFIMVIFIAILVCLFYDKEKIKKVSMLACIGFIPMMWYVLIGDHSKVHTRFTYRALITTIVSYIYMLFVLIDKNSLIYLCKKFTQNKNI